ncbi:putative isoaspartyl peptidase/L-asparaginase 3 [Cucurbita argyrosperma subsp. argyrosperma]|nr:putative isoaspartyl peptidase/L-asparaginase 3 [Cucurbita argyrosperma subsp. argyrosperma]
MELLASNNRFRASALLLVLLFQVTGRVAGESGSYPLVVSTWPFLEAVERAWSAVNNGSSAVDAVVEGCSACEELRCDGTVGAVAAMRYIKDGIKAARLVMRHTQHTLLVGEKASAFSISMGLPGPEDLSSSESIEKWNKWKENNCQPNFWKNVVPVNSCGPYHSNDLMLVAETTCSGDDPMRTVGSRVGDGPIAGSSAYADSDIGACGATGDGDIMMRFLPYQVVESMRLGMEPKDAAKDAISRIARKFPDFIGAIFAVNKNGTHAGACHGWTFQYSVRSPEMHHAEVFTVLP